MQVGQRLAVIEPATLRHEGFDKAQELVGAIDETGDDFMWVSALLVAALVEPAFRAGGVLGRGQIGEGQEVARLEMRAGFLEIGLALGIDQGRSRIGKNAIGVRPRGMALRFDEDRPAGPETAEGVVQSPRNGDQLSRHRRIQIGPTKPRGALETAVLVEDDTFAHQSRPGQEIGKATIAVAVFGEVHHRPAPRSNR